MNGTMAASYYSVELWNSVNNSGAKSLSVVQCTINGGGVSLSYSLECRT